MRKKVLSSSPLVLIIFDGSLNDKITRSFKKLEPNLFSSAVNMNRYSRNSFRSLKLEARTIEDAYFNWVENLSPAFT